MIIESLEDKLVLRSVSVIASPGSHYVLLWVRMMSVLV